MLHPQPVDIFTSNGIRFRNCDFMPRNLARAARHPARSMMMAPQQRARHLMPIAVPGDERMSAGALLVGHPPRMSAM
jgi:hypothetical protein